MTQKLDELFNLEQPKKPTKEIMVVDNLPAISEDVDQQIINLTDVSQHALDMDALAATAMSAYEDIVDHADSFESKDYASVMAVAVQMQKNAIAAKDSKLKARQKAAEILLKKQELDAARELDDASIIDADSEAGENDIMANRNDMLNRIRGKE